MKVLGTNIMVGGEMIYKIREKGYSGFSNQFRIICKCRGINDANKKCKNIGLHDRVFVPAYTSETGNKIELKLCEKEDIWFCIDETKGVNGYISAKELLD